MSKKIKHTCTLPDICEHTNDNRCCCDCDMASTCEHVCCDVDSDICEERVPRELKSRKESSERGFLYMLILMLIVGQLTIIYSIGCLSEKMDSLTDELMKVNETIKENNVTDNLSNKVYEVEQSIQECEETSVTERNSPTSTLSNDDRTYIERVVMAECGNQPYLGQIAVAQTIKDRADLWQMTPIEVVTAKNQYANPYKGEVTDSIKLAVTDVFDNGARAFDEPTTHFYSGSTPYWADNKTLRGVIQDHTFMY